MLDYPLARRVASARLRSRPDLIEDGTQEAALALWQAGPNASYPAAIAYRSVIDFFRVWTKHRKSHDYLNPRPIFVPLNVASDHGDMEQALHRTILASQIEAIEPVLDYYEQESHSRPERYQQIRKYARIRKRLGVKERSQ